MGTISRVFELYFSAKDKASKTIDTVTAAVDKSTKGIDALNKKFNFLFAAAVAERAINFTKTLIDANDALQDLSDRTGESVETLSKLSAAAQAGDVPLETLQKALHLLNRSMIETPGIFEAFGISLADKDGKLKSANDVFGDIAEKIAAIENPARRAAAATEFFKKSGVDLLPVLKKGKEGLREWAQTTEELGAVTSSNLAFMSSDFNDNLQRIQMAGKGISNSVGEQVLPYLNLLMSAFIEYRKEEVALSKSMDNGTKSVKSFADSPGWKDLIDVIGNVGDFIQALANVTQGAFAILSGVIGRVVNELVTSIQFVSSVLSGDFRGALAVLKQGMANTVDIAKKSGDDLAKAFGGERFSDVLGRNLKKAATAVEEASKKAAESTTKTATLSRNEAIKIVNSSEQSIKAISSVVEAASAKAKEALETQKKTVEAFEALAKRLNKEAPKNGTLDQNLSKAGREEDARKKKAALIDKDTADAQATFFAATIAQLQAVADEERKKAEADKGFYQAEKVRNAEAAVLAEEMAQKAIARNAEIAKIDKEAQAQVTSDIEALAIRNAAADELKDITEQIQKNGKAGTRNDAEIKRLTDIGVLLEKNKTEASGVFNTSELAKYSKELAAISAAATKADVEATKAIEAKAFEDAKEKMDILKTSLSSIAIGIDDAAINAEADRVKAILEDKLKAIVIPLKLSEAYGSSMRADSGKSPFDGAQKFADGGIVRGPGGSRGDKIPAWLSAGENITPYHIMQKPGMYALQDFINRGGDISTILKGAGSAANSGGGITSSERTSSFSIDLRTNSGNLKLNSDMTQDQLNRELRKQNQRRS